MITELDNYEVIRNQTFDTISLLSVISFNIFSLLNIFKFV